MENERRVPEPFQDRLHDAERERLQVVVSDINGPQLFETMESTVIESSQSVFCQDQPLEAGQPGKSPAVNLLYDIVLQHELLKAYQLGECIRTHPVQVVCPHV